MVEQRLIKVVFPEIKEGWGIAYRYDCVYSIGENAVLNEDMIPGDFYPKCHTWDSTNPGVCLYTCERAKNCPWAGNRNVKKIVKKSSENI